MNDSSNLSPRYLEIATYRNTATFSRDTYMKIHRKIIISSRWLDF